MEKQIENGIGSVDFFFCYLGFSMFLVCVCVCAVVCHLISPQTYVRLEFFLFIFVICAHRTHNDTYTHITPQVTECNVIVVLSSSSMQTHAHSIMHNYISHITFYNTQYDKVLFCFIPKKQMKSEEKNNSKLNVTFYESLYCLRALHSNSKFYLLSKSFIFLFLFLFAF